MKSGSVKIENTMKQVTFFVILKLFNYSLLLGVVFMLACKPSRQTNPVEAGIANDSSLNDSLAFAKVLDSIRSTIPPEAKPVMGYRFKVKGDFNGDGTNEMLTEYYRGMDLKAEMPKFYDSTVTYEQLMAVAWNRKAYSYGVTGKASIRPLVFSSSARHLGLAWLHNEGDLDGNGTDELSYVMNWADWSSTNLCHVMTYRNKRWEKLLEIPIWEWQLPEVPMTYNQYGLFGKEGMRTLEESTANSQNAIDSLETFSGFIQKIKPGIIKVHYRNPEACEDTIRIDLTKKIPVLL